MPVAIPFIAAAAFAAADVAAVGVAAATLTGVLTAASLGFAAGSIIGNLLFPTHTTTSNVGPRIGDLTVQVSTYGVAIPITFGTDRLSGNVIWALPIKEVATTTTQSSGGKKGKGGTSSAATTTFTYFGNFAVGLCEGVKAGITRIWANNNLIYDSRTGTDVIKSDGVNFTFYSGSETQLPDPSMEADKGVGNVPGHRGLCYAVFHDLPLVNYGNALPSLSFEVADQVQQSYTIVPYVLGPALLAADPSATVSDLGIDFTKNTGFALCSVGISTFDLTSGAIINEALTGDVFSGSFGTTFNRLSIGTDGFVYTVGHVGFGFFQNHNYLIKINPTALQEISGALIVDGGLLGSPQLDPDGVSNRVFNLDGTVSDYMLYLFQISTTAQLIVMNTTSMARIFVSDEFTCSHSVLIDIARGPISSGFSDFFVATDPNSGTCEVRRVRVNSDVGSMLLFRTLIASDFTGTATSVSNPRIGGIDFAAAILIMGITVAEPGPVTNNWTFALDLNSGDIIWKTLVAQPNGEIVTSPNYGNIQGNILTEYNTGMLTDTATGIGTDLQSPTLPLGETVYWDSATLSYVQFGLGQPFQRVFVGRFVGQPTTLGSICGGISDRVQNSDYDTTTISAIGVTGFTISRADSAANALNSILAGFQVDVVETDYKVKFKLRGSTTVVDLTEGDLVDQTSTEAPEPYKETWQQSIELPSYLNITYEDPALDYQPNTQHDQRVRIAANPTVFSGQTSDVQVPIVMDATTAQQMASELLYTTWLNRHTFQLRLAPRYLWLDPADPVNLTLRGGYTLRARLGKTDLGVDFTNDTLLVSETDGQYTSSLTVTVTNPFPLTIAVALSSFLILLDTPLLRDGDEVIASSLRGYWGASSFATGSYQGATLFESSDGASWAQLDRVTIAVPFGYVEVPPPDPTLMWLVELGTSLTVSMANGSSHLASVTDLDLCNGANAAALLKTNGEVEIFQYRDVTALGSDRFTLTNLLRGRRGSDTMAIGHVAGELFVLLGTGAVRGLAGSISERNLPLWWGAVTVGATPNPALRESFTFNARDKFPYAPVDVTAMLSGGDIDLMWVRRTRVDGALRDGGTGEVPLHETTEAYEVDIFSGPGGSLKRTLTGLIAPTATYMSADVITDFGSPPASLTVRVYQISAIVGRGFSREDTVVVG